MNIPLTLATGVALTVATLSYNNDDIKSEKTNIKKENITINKVDTTKMIEYFISGVNPKIDSNTASTYSKIIVDVSKKYNVDPALISGIIAQESKFKTNSESEAGAKGLSGIMPHTAKSFLDSVGYSNNTDIKKDFKANINICAYYINHLNKHYGQEEVALAHYNGGNSGAKYYKTKVKYSNYWEMSQQQLEKSRVYYTKHVRNNTQLKAIYEVIDAKHNINEETYKYVPIILNYRRQILAML